MNSNEREKGELEAEDNEKSVLLFNERCVILADILILSKPSNLWVILSTLTKLLYFFLRMGIRNKKLKRSRIFLGKGQISPLPRLRG